jgi:hypothetical protein
MRYRRRVGSFPSRAASRAALIAAAALAGASATGCGGGTVKPPAPASSVTAERLWVDNARRFVYELQQDILLTAAGGADLATARRAIKNESDIYSLLIAYSLFGGCARELAAAGTPSRTMERASRLIASACVKLERASALFQDAMTHNRPEALLVATRTAAEAVPDLTSASTVLGGIASS